MKKREGNRVRYRGKIEKQTKEMAGEIQEMWRNRKEEDKGVNEKTRQGKVEKKNLRE